MNKYKLLSIAIAILSALPLMAQQPPAQSTRAGSTGGRSPHETTSGVIDGNRVTITYGRPYSKAPGSSEVRKIWGGLVPYGKIWRTGSDEATILITQQPIEISGTTIPAGAYTLWTLPNEDGTAKLIVNKQIGQWGINPRDSKSVYDEKNDVGRFDMKKEALEKPVDQFTMAVARNPSGGGLIKMSWENTEFSVPFTVKK